MNKLLYRQRMLFFAIGIFLLLIFIFYAIPRTKSYVSFNLHDYNALVSPLMFYSPDLNLVILYNNGKHDTLSSDRRSLLSYGGPLQISGVGFRQSDGFTPGFYTYYCSILSSEAAFSEPAFSGSKPPQIQCKTGGFTKTFYIHPNSDSITVDGVNYHLNIRKPLVLLIASNGAVSQIEAFDISYGVNLYDVLQNPLLLSDVFRDYSDAPQAAIVHEVPDAMSGEYTESEQIDDQESD